MSHVRLMKQLKDESSAPINIPGRQKQINPTEPAVSNPIQQSLVVGNFQDYKNHLAHKQCMNFGKEIKKQREEQNRNETNPSKGEELDFDFMFSPKL